MQFVIFWASVMMVRRMGWSLGQNLNIKCNYNTIMKRLTTPDPGQVRFLHSWMQAVLPTTEVQLEQLGNGVQYCLLMQEYYPNILPLKRVCLNPRTKMDSIANLKLLGQVFVILKWNHIGFDVNRIANCSFHDCIQLLAKMHASLASESSHSQAKPSFGYSQHHTVQPPSAKSMTVPVYSPINSHKPSPSLNYFPSAHSKQSSKPTTSSQQQFSVHHSHIEHNTNFKATSTPSSLTPLKLQSTMMNSALSSQSHQILEDIKKIVSLGNQIKTDREKVRELKIMLGIELEQKAKYKSNEEQQGEGDKDLLYNLSEHHNLKKASTIVIDNDNDNDNTQQSQQQ